MGHLLHVPFARLAPWPDALDQVREAGYLIAAMTPQPPRDGADGPGPVPLACLAERPAAGAPRPDEGARPSSARPVALVLGAEGPGLSRPVLDAADVVVSIPMAPGVDSLNVATAAAIAFDRLSAQPGGVDAPSSKASRRR
jgi:tRNA G18 (ribose-2'-O)-methylase SpoU